MFVAVYRFVVHPGTESAFEAAWRALTDLIYRHQGSLGSRLHRGEDGVYVAYAQWPSREAWAAPSAMGEDADAVRVAMKACCLEIETVYALDVIDDALAPSVHRPEVASAEPFRPALDASVSDRLPLPRD